MSPPKRRKKTRKKSMMSVVAKLDNNEVKISKVAESDQMNIILRVLGVPNSEDLSYMSKAKQKAFLKTYDQPKGKSYSSMFPDEDDD